MRFAEDMLLNAKIYEMVPYRRHDGQDRRCALGLVEGDRRRINNGHFEGFLVYKPAEDKYPWIVDTPTGIPPCGCHPAQIRIEVGLSEFEEVLPMMFMIVHLFNEHVMQGGGRLLPGWLRGPRKPWTLEQLADYIETHDPTPRTEEILEQPTTVRKESDTPILAAHF